MKVITAVRKYIKTEKEIFLQSMNDIGVFVVHKDKDFCLDFGDKVASAKVHHIDETESPDAVTIYL